MSSEPQDEKDYWSLLESSQRSFYPDFVNRLSSQVGGMAEEGRAAVIEFGDGAGPSIKHFPASRKLRRYMDRGPLGAVHRRVFVLEGLPRNAVQVLGAKLRVPPSFFAAHWLNPGAYVGNLLNRTPRHHDHRHRCILSFRRLHHTLIEAADDNDGATGGGLYHMDSSTCRPLSRLTVFGDYDGPLASSEQVSIWSSKGEGNRWDAVVLVDPPMGDFVYCKGSPKPLKVEHSESVPLAPGIMYGQEGSWYPPHSLDADPSAEAASHRPAAMRNFFDDILALSADRPAPADCLHLYRHMVLLA